MKLKRRGFTLVEIMIVVAIVGVVVAIAIPNFQNARRLSEETACNSNARLLQSALIAAAAAQGDKLSINSLSQDEIMAVAYPDYLKTMPSCPARGVYYTDENGNIMCSYHSVIPFPGGGIITLSESET